MSDNLQVLTREQSTKSHLRQLRQNGWVPGVIYGKDIGGLPIQIHRGDLLAWIRRESRHALVSLSIDGKERMNAMIHDLQIDPLDRQVLHVDFHQIKRGQKVNTAIPVVLVGTALGVREGGVLQQQLTEIEVRALPEKLPSAIEVTIDHLEIGDQLRVSDLTIPEGIELRTSEDELIASITMPNLDPVEKDITLDHPAMVEVTDEHGNIEANQ